mgnify:CR=1 FL=1
MPDARALYQTLFEHIEFSACLIDREGVIRFAEGRLLRSLGMAPEMLIGLRVTDFFPREAAEAQMFERVLAGEAITTRMTFGEQILEVRSSPTRDAQGEIDGVVTLTTDVSERVQAERALEARTAELQRQADLLDLAHDAIAVYKPDGTIVAWHRGAERMYGWSAAEAVGHSAQTLLGTRLPEAFEAIVATLRETGHWQGELLRTTRDGRELVVLTRWATRKDEAGMYILEIGTDITQRKQEMEAKIRGEEIIRAQSRAIQELSTPLIPITDDILVMPLVGLMDAGRVAQVMEALLAGLAATRGKVAILDITGVSVVDTHVADALIRAARAARLLGAEVILTGIRPEVAQTLVTLETDLGSIVTLGTLQAGIRHALRGRPLAGR